MAVTRADVARRAGVSPAVVSYVLLPDSRPVAPATRKKVLAAIEELGYRPNAIAQALRRGPTSSIGLLVPDHTNPFFSELTSEIEDLAFEHTYILLAGSTADSPTREAKYVKAFIDRRVDAILIVGTRAHPELEKAMRSGTPVLVIDRVPPGSTVSSVRTDGASGAVAAVEHLAARGHRAIGIIAGPQGLAVADDRVTGWKLAAERLGLGAEESLVERAPFTLPGGVSAAATLLRRRPDVTAVFVSSDIQACGVLAHCASARLSVPDDLAVVSFDGTRIAPYANPPLTVIQQPIREMARTAVQRIFERIEAPGQPPTHDVLGTTLVVRGSS